VKTIQHLNNFCGDFFDPEDSSIVEKFHMIFIKEILGVTCVKELLHGTKRVYAATKKKLNRK
jgi:hypothetical protein